MDLSMLGRQPVSLESPAGADVRHEPVYEELQAEVGKLSSPAAAGGVDWDKVARLAADILLHKSKDLLVAGYLSVALIHTRGHGGFGAGLAMYLDLVERFWEELYPQKSRLQGRLRSLEWWLEKTESALKQDRRLPAPGRQSALIADSLNRLDAFLRVRLERAPSLAPLTEYFSALADKAVANGLTEAPAPGDPVGAGHAGSGAACRRPEAQGETVAQRCTTPREAQRALDDGLVNVAAASFFLWHQDRALPQFYRLARQSVWYAVGELPPAADGRTGIPPPSSQVKKLLLELHDTGGAEELLLAAESRQPQYIFWLDLSHLVAVALERLGSRFEKARAAVCQETAFLQHRLPGLELLSFSDGTPFAAPDTRHWLKGIAFGRDLAPPSPTLAAQPTPDEETETCVENQLAGVQQLISGGRLVEALEVVRQKLSSSASRREQLLWRLALARMLTEVGKSSYALPHLEQVLEDIDSFGLEQYDPGLALRGLKLAWLACENRTEQKFKEQALQVLHRIGRISLPEMVRLIDD